MKKRAVAVLVATVLAVVGALLVVVYAKNADKRAIANAQPTTVYIAQKKIASGTTLREAERSQLLVQTQVAARAVPAGALKEITSENATLLATTDVQPGEILISARFGERPVGSKNIEITQGMIAVSIELEDPARVGKFVTPGSRIAVYRTYKIVDTDNDEDSKHFNSFNFKGTDLVLPDVKVIAMGEEPLSAPKKSSGTGDAKANDRKAQSFLVTVEVKPEDSVKLVHAIQSYELYAGLRGDEVTFPPNAVWSDAGTTVQFRNTPR